MTQQDFLEKFASQFEETDIADITFDTEFKAIDEWSSMMALVIIAMVDDEYNLTLTGEDIRSSVKVSDLFEKIVSKSNN